MRTAALLAGHGGDDDGGDQQTHTHRQAMLLRPVLRRILMLRGLIISTVLLFP